MCNLKHEDSYFEKVTVSMGIKSSKIVKNQNSSSFLKEADKSLYKAKESSDDLYLVSSL